MRHIDWIINCNLKKKRKKRGILQAVETNSIGITTQLHVPEMQPCPICVKLCRFYKGKMHSQTTMHRRTVDAQEDTVRHAGPCWILRVTIKTCLKEWELLTQILKLLKHWTIIDGNYNWCLCIVNVPMEYSYINDPRNVQLCSTDWISSRDPRFRMCVTWLGEILERNCNRIV